MALRIVELHADRKNPLGAIINRETDSITGLYSSFLPKYKSGAYAKVIVHTSENKALQDRVEEMLNVIMITQIFDYEAYINASKQERKQKMLDVLQQGLLRLAEKEGWEQEPLKQAYQCCMDKNLEYQFVIRKKFFRSPDRRHFAGVWCNWDIDKFEAFALFLNQAKEEIGRVRFINVKPWEAEPFGEIYWSDAETFVVHHKVQNKKWEIRLPLEG